MGIRKIIFWAHLITGVCVGLVVLFLALTGLTLSFERQITAWAERGSRFVAASGAAGQRLGLGDLAQKVEQAYPGIPITGLTLYADSGRTLFFDLGKGVVVYLNPFTGAVLGRGAQGWRSFFEKVTALHRWFGLQGKSRDAARWFKGICTLLFGFLVLSGLYIWFPQKWTKNVFRVIGVPNLKLRGQPRDFNWHNAVGFWTAPWLLVIIVTGLIMAFPWAEALLYRMTGNEPPLRTRIVQNSPPNGGSGKSVEKRKKHGKGKANPSAEPSALPLDAYLAAVNKQCPGWVSLDFKLSPKKSGDVTVAVEEAGAPRPYARSLMILDPASAKVLDWEPYSGQNAGRRARSWVRPLHTGEAGGAWGQLLAALAALGAVLQVITGFSLAWRRFFVKV